MLCDQSGSLRHAIPVAFDKSNGRSRSVPAVGIAVVLLAACLV